MLSKKDKARLKKIKTIHELFDELLCVDEKQKSFVDEASDLLPDMNIGSCNHLIDYLKHCIAKRRQK